MMNDSVREELEDRISYAPKPVRYDMKTNPPAVNIQNPPIFNKPLVPPPWLKNRRSRLWSNQTQWKLRPNRPARHWWNFKIKMRSAEWRYPVQNFVRKRVEGERGENIVEAMPPVRRVNLPTNGANALKAEIIEETAPAPAKSHAKLENALRRIEESRRRFSNSEVNETAPKMPPAAAQNKNYPFYLATKNAEVLPKPPEMKTSAQFSVKPKFEELPLIEKDDYDTNKLKPLPNSMIISSSIEKKSVQELSAAEAAPDAPLIKISRVKSEMDEEESFDPETVDDEIEDLAPFAMRFNSGLFDLIIGAFTSLILLAPFILSGGSWVSIPGLLAFLVTCSIVMFIYLTTAIGLCGKTLGMKLFSLEAIDIEENDYPTFHQAAVSSSVYLVSLALGGIGFLPALFNSERRTAPDLLSGTIIVKEY